ncbi:MAG TPA: class I SAM-dependent methyltransferase [Acidobacteriota bacterium]|nr:class I SAM-dependent methyltransferase [Acidobacteriota bacterium]
MEVPDEIASIADGLVAPILDFGCGSGALVKLLRNRGKEAYGIEIERKEIVDAIPRDVADFITLYDGKLPLNFSKNEFKSTIASEVLEHLPDHEEYLKEVWRITEDVVVITVPDMSAIPVCFPHNVVPWHLLESTHVNFFNQVSLELLLKKYFPRVEIARIGLNITNGTRWFTSLVAICTKQ